MIGRNSSQSLDRRGRIADEEAGGVAPFIVREREGGEMHIREGMVRGKGSREIKVFV